MSTVSQKSQVSGRQLIDTQISATRRALKLVDLFAGLLTLIIGLLVFLFIAALLEHWIVPGGWSLTARSVLFSLLMVGVGWYGWRTFWPLLQTSINPIYAAQTLENNSPTLKNSLLSLLLFRKNRQQISASVYQTIEQQAATRLSQIPVDTAVDRAVVLRLGYVLVAVAATFALYCLLSPKNPIISASRVLFPWSSIRVPSRVQITDIHPGEVSVARGDRLTVAANIQGMSVDEQAVLYYQTRPTKDLSARSEPLSIPMQGPGPATSMSLERQCQLPDTSHDGVEQDIDYWIEAGDARSATYEVHVFARPTIVVKRVRYDYPSYTGYPSREVNTTGDLDALEGTRVTLFGLSNHPIQEAFVDFNADGRHDLPMQIIGDQNARDQVRAQFPLTLRSDRRTPSYVSYVLRFTTTTKRSNRQPPKYRIAVTPDYAPEIRLAETDQLAESDGGNADEMVVRPMDEQMTVEVEASDPDFALSEVRVVGHLEQAGVNPQENPSSETVRLNRVLLSKNHTGRFLGQTMFTLGQLNLHEGDVLVYWAEARDNRTPEANISVTSPRRVRITRPQSSESPDSRRPENPQDPAESPEDDQTSEGSAADETGDDGESGESSSSSGESGESGSSSSGEDSESGENGSSSSGEDSESGESGSSSSSESSEGGENGESGSSSSSESGERGGSEDRVKGDGAHGNQNTGGESDQSGGTDSDGTGQGSSASENDTSSEKAGNQQSPESTADEQGSALEKVSSEGDDDGTAFERLLEHLAEEEANQDPTSEQDGESQSTGESGEKSPEQGEAGAEGSTEDSQPEDPSTGSPEERESQSTGASGEKSPEQGEAGAGESPSDEQTGASSEQARKPSDKQSGSEAGETSGDQQDPAMARDQRESDSQGGQSGDRSGGGDQGAGQQADSEGTGSDGQHQAADEGSGQSEQPGAGQTGSRPGDTPSSQGDQGTSGDNQEAADGAQGESSKPGKNQSDQGRSGADNKSGDPSNGQSNNQPSGQQPDQSDTASDPSGNSSETSPSANGEQSKSPSANEPTPGESTNSSGQPDTNTPDTNTPDTNTPDANTPDTNTQPPDSPAQDRPSQDPPAQGSPSAQEGGGGGQSSNVIPPGPEQEAAAGDAANLDYARQQTDLVLNRLADQFKRGQVDQKMLDKVGWTEQELQRFLQRWKNLKSMAVSNDDQAQSAQTELNAALRSLGLRKNRQMSFEANHTQDNLRDLRDTYRSRVPAAFVERMRAYVKGTAKGEERGAKNESP